MTCPHLPESVCACWRQPCCCPLNRWPALSSEPCFSEYAYRMWKKRQKLQQEPVSATDIPESENIRLCLRAAAANSYATHNFLQAILSVFWARPDSSNS